MDFTWQFSFRRVKFYWTYISTSHKPSYFAAAQHFCGSVVKYLLNISNLKTYVPGEDIHAFSLEYNSDVFNKGVDSRPLIHT